MQALKTGGPVALLFKGGRPKQGSVLINPSYPVPLPPWPFPTPMGSWTQPKF